MHAFKEIVSPTRHEQCEAHRLCAAKVAAEVSDLKSRSHSAKQISIRKGFFPPLFSLSNCTTSKEEKDIQPPYDDFFDPTDHTTGIAWLCGLLLSRAWPLYASAYKSIKNKNEPWHLINHLHTMDSWQCYGKNTKHNFSSRADTTTFHAWIAIYGTPGTLVRLQKMISAGAFSVYVATIVFIQDEMQPPGLISFRSSHGSSGKTADLAAHERCHTKTWLWHFHAFFFWGEHYTPKEGVNVRQDHGLQARTAVWEMGWNNTHLVRVRYWLRSSPR
jgi:hypothetical protein